MEGLTKQTAVVVHRYPLWREALQDTLLTLGFDVLATTDSPSEAIRLANAAGPDLLVAGSTLSSSEAIDGIECVRRARAAAPELRAVVISAAYDASDAAAALDAGAYAYIVETTHPDDIRAAIRQGFHPSVFMSSADAPKADPQSARKRAARGLTKREEEILRLVAEGRSNSEVAAKLWVTEQTVKFHLSNIYRKLGVANRTEAGRWAQLAGLMDDDGARNALGA